MMVTGLDGCAKYKDCSEHAKCDSSGAGESYLCKCIAGYKGDGKKCSGQLMMMMMMMMMMVVVL